MKKKQTLKPVEAWQKYKIRSYGEHLEHIAKLKQKLYTKLLNKCEGGFATDNEIRLVTVLARDEDVQEILDPGYTKGVDREEEQKLATWSKYDETTELLDSQLPDDYQLDN